MLDSRSAGDFMSSNTIDARPDIDLGETIPLWSGEPVRITKGSPATLTKMIPNFDRRPFSMSSIGSSPAEQPKGASSLGENDLYDLIVRLPLNEQEAEIPVGAVSKHYKLVQHRDLFELACEAIKAASIDLEHLEATLELSVFGSKMAITFTLPKEFDFEPGDGQNLNLQFHCVNSVDGRSRLRIMLGWFRFVCGNGLVVGTALLGQRFIHNEYLDLPDLGHVLTDGLKSAEQEKASFTKWMGTPIEESRLVKWSDGPLRDEWGPFAAARVHLICRTGCDGRFARQGEKAPPHRKGMIPMAHVPGAPLRAENAYHVAQALSWIARSKRDIQDQLDGMIAIPKLMDLLLK